MRKYLLLGAVLAVLVLLAHQQYAAEPVSAELNGTKIVYLTFDDVPTAHTDEILDMLKTHGIKATFFVLDVYIDKHPDSVRRILEEGHAIGLHGTSHDTKKIYATDTSPVEEMLCVSDRLREEFGATSRIVRVPYGSSLLTEAQRANLADAGFILWDWNVDTKDANGANVSTGVIYQNAVKGLARGDRCVLLMHNMRASKKALPQILSYISANGFETRVITEEDTPVQFHKKNPS